MCIAYRTKFDVATTSNFDVVTTEVNRVCRPITYIAYRPKFDVLTKSNFGVVTMDVDWRYIDVAYIMLSTYVRCVPTYIRRLNNVKLWRRYDGGWSTLHRRCVYVVRHRDFIATYFRRRNNVGVPAGNFEVKNINGTNGKRENRRYTYILLHLQLVS